MIELEHLLNAAGGMRPASIRAAVVQVLRNSSSECVATTTMPAASASFDSRSFAFSMKLASPAPSPSSSSRISAWIAVDMAKSRRARMPAE